MNNGAVIRVTVLSERHRVLDTYRAKIIKEYGSFYLVDRGIFKTCINKADIKCSKIILA